VSQEEIDAQFAAIIADLYPNAHEQREQAHYGLAEETK